MNQCECDDTISSENQSLGVENMNNAPTTCATDPVAMAVKESGALEQPQDEEDHHVLQTVPVDLQPCEMSEKPDLESAVPIQQVTQAPTSPTTTGNIMISKSEPPPLQPVQPPPLQPLHRPAPSNQTNIVMGSGAGMGSTTSCITGFQSTFSQEHVGLPDPHRPAHYTEPLPNSICHQQYQWQHQQQQVPMQQHHQPHYHHANQYINVNNNASPECLGIERPAIGLVKQVLEVFKISGKLEMQPSEVYYELEKQHPYYRFLTPQKRKSWMSSVRHALTNPQFKARRCAEDEGKPVGSRRGHFWSIDENYVPGQENTPNRPSPSYRRRSKVMKAGGGCNYIRSPSGQLISEPSLMSPPITYATTMQSNGIPVILPTPQFNNGQALQLVPAVNHGMNGSPQFPKQSPGGNTNGQFLWIPPANGSPQQQPQLQQHQMQFNGNAQWAGHSPVATFQPGFNGNAANNYNFSNNIQQHQQLQQQGQMQQLQHQQQANVMHNAQAFRYASPIAKPQTVPKCFTTGNRVNVVGNLSPQNSMQQLHLQQQQLQQQQQQMLQQQQQRHQQTEQPISNATQTVTSCAAAVQAFADLARATENMVSQADIGPGGDTTPTSEETLSHEAQAENQVAQDSQATATDIAESQELQVNSQILKSTEETQDANSIQVKQETQEATDNISSSEPSSAGQTRDGLFPVGLYTSGNPGDEKRVLPSVETLAQEMAQHTQRTQAELKGDKNSEECKAELRAMVYNEVCNAGGGEQEAQPAMLSTAHVTNAAPESSAMDMPQSDDTVTLQVTQRSVDEANPHWSIEQVQY